ncbi:MAG: hypothetical protein RLZZ450_7649, partial [Pseudomonadota bacterium]
MHARRLGDGGQVACAVSAIKLLAREVVRLPLLRGSVTIKLSGLYFGLPFGILQMAQWVYLPLWWTLPVA